MRENSQNSRFVLGLPLICMGGFDWVTGISTAGNVEVYEFSYQFAHILLVVLEASGFEV